MKDFEALNLMELIYVKGGNELPVHPGNCYDGCGCGETPKPKTYPD